MWDDGSLSPGHSPRELAKELAKRIDLEECSPRAMKAELAKLYARGSLDEEAYNKRLKVWEMATSGQGLKSTRGFARAVRGGSVAFVHSFREGGLGRRMCHELGQCQCYRWCWPPTCCRRLKELEDELLEDADIADEESRASGRSSARSSIHSKLPDDSEESEEEESSEEESSSGSDSFDEVEEEKRQRHLGKDAASADLRTDIKIKTDGDHHHKKGYHPGGIPPNIHHLHPGGAAPKVKAKASPSAKQGETSADEAPSRPKAQMAKTDAELRDEDAENDDGGQDGWVYHDKEEEDEAREEEQYQKKKAERKEQKHADRKKKEEEEESEERAEKDQHHKKEEGKEHHHHHHDKEGGESHHHHDR